MNKKQKIILGALVALWIGMLICAVAFKARVLMLMLPIFFIMIIIYTIIASMNLAKGLFDSSPEEEQKQQPTKKNRKP